MSPTFSATFDPALETPALARHRLEGWLPPSLADNERGTLRLLKGFEPGVETAQLAVGDAARRLHGRAGLG